MKDVSYMHLAMELAKATLNQTSPNPSVGCVVVKDGVVVGFGAHLKSGEKHAEVIALEMAAEKAMGSTVYVTLEPCAHYGKTPPCADLLIAKKVKRVVVATIDNNPSVAGKGIEMLQQAGIVVEVGVMKEEADALLQRFFTNISEQIPYVVLKAAVSMDGKMQAANGDSKWITNEESRRDVHDEREKHDAILVGVETVINDNPELTVRYGENRKQPLRIVLDTKLRTPLHSKVVTDQLKTIFICGDCEVAEKKTEMESYGNEVMELSDEERNLKNILFLLFKRGICSLYVEGGSTVHSSFIKEELFHEIHLYIAPKLLGGANAFFRENMFNRMEDAVSLKLSEVKRFGDDCKMIWKK